MTGYQSKRAAAQDKLAQPAQEPVAWVGLTPFDFENLEQLYLHKVANEFVLSDIICIVEAKLKEKNK
jgi:hypothetical protein